jgi:hypothetical protein
MNIFYLDHDVEACAKMHCNKHVVKMILEYAQLLSTAHRVIDGKETIERREIKKSPSKFRNVKVWRLPDSTSDNLLYKATHINHPSALWVRQSSTNYMWLAMLLYNLCKEYTHRYTKVHKVEVIGLSSFLIRNVPIKLMNKGIGKFTQPTPAMPDTYKVMNDSITSYRNYYIGDKAGFAKWTNRPVPYWFKPT